MGSQRVDAIFREENSRILISRLTVVEVQSAFALKVRTGMLSESSWASLRLRVLDEIAAGAIAVLSVKDAHYAISQHLILKYGNVKGLRTLDAIQIAVALEAYNLRGTRRVGCSGQDGD